MKSSQMNGHCYFSILLLQLPSNLEVARALVVGSDFFLQWFLLIFHWLPPQSLYSQSAIIDRILK